MAEDGFVEGEYAYYWDGDSAERVVATMRHNLRLMTLQMMQTVDPAVRRDTLKTLGLCWCEYDGWEPHKHCQHHREKCCHCGCEGQVPTAGVEPATETLEPSCSSPLS